VPTGSPAATQRILDYNSNLNEQALDAARDTETGRKLFGAPKVTHWGTMHDKFPNAYAVGDWGEVGYAMKALCKVSDTEYLVKPVYKGVQPVLLRGLDMSKVSDGVQFTLPHSVLITGTFSYKTVDGGLKTVMVLDTAEMLKQADKLQADERAKIEAMEAEKIANLPPAVRAAMERQKAALEARQAAAEARKKAELADAPRKEGERLEKKAGVLLAYAKKLSSSPDETQKAKARERLQEIIKDFPDTEAAKEAKQQLDKLSK